MGPRYFLAAALAAALFAGAACAAALPEHSTALDAAQGQYAVIAPIFNGAGGNFSFIRLVNARGTADSSTPSATTYAITVVGSPTGTEYGTATIQVAPNASPQYSISQILTLANVGSLTGSDTALSLYVRNPDEGAGFMHVIYNNATTFFENASICQGYVQADTDNKYLFNVHTSLLPTYPSQIYMHNYANAALTYRVTVRDARSGTSVGTTDMQVGANATISLPFASFEQLIGWTPATDQLHANMTFEAVGVTPAPVLVGLFIYNQVLLASINMSSVCRINVAEANSGSTGGGTTFTLTTSKSGAGFGTVVSSPAGINCGFLCLFGFNTGAAVTLTPTAGNASTFQGWSGACAGTGPCVVTMDASKNANAVFALTTNTLTVSKSGAGSGTVVSSQAGINCGSECTFSFAAGGPVSLTANPANGSRFAGWSGACTGTGICGVTMSSAQSVTATFEPNFTVTVTVTGRGQVTSSPGSIVCGILGNDCTIAVATGTTVSLSAGAAGTFQGFLGWSGPCVSISTNPGDSICSVVVNSNQSVTANFSP